jgi:hypothetical protein
MLFSFGDVNGDGFPDIAVSHQYGTIYLNNGDSTFSLADGNLPPAGSLGRLGISLGDVNNDGKKDLAFTTYNGGVEVWVYQGDQQWSDFSGSLPTSGPYEATQLYDMNGDGNMDVVAFGNGVVTVWLGDGSGNWYEATSIYMPGAPGNFQALRVGGDADHNGYPDIVLVDEEGSWWNYQNHLRFYKEASTPDSLFIWPISPRVNETWLGGSVKTIEWACGVPNDNIGAVKLEISSSGTNGPWFTIAEDIPNNGKYQWIVMFTIYSDSAYMRYTVYTSQDTATALAGPFKLRDLYGCGDVNRDFSVSSLDVVYLANYLFTGGPPPIPLMRGDVNGDCEVNVSDLLYLVTYLFTGGLPLFCCGS